MSTEIPDETWSEIKAALYSGNKIEAIKLYRDATGLGLKESKESVEKLETELRASEPDKFKSAAAGSKGCFSILLMCVGLVTALTALTNL